MTISIKLAQINIEHEKHVEEVISFLLTQKPDVVCLQELQQGDVSRLEEALGMTCLYAPMTRFNDNVGGIGIFSNLPFSNQVSTQYGGNKEAELPTYNNATKQLMHDTARFVLAITDVEKEGETFRVATTHFPVTEHGEATDYQRTGLQAMLALLEKEGELVLTGDFNAPRGREIFSVLAEKFKDNIPLQYTSSLDPVLHRAAPLELMVDGIFSTPSYEVSSVEGHTGISDHLAFTALVSRARK